MGRPRASRPDHGQAAVELALALPLVVVALLAIVQVVLVARDQLAVIHAAREAARAASLATSAPVADGTAAGRAAAGLDGVTVEVDVETRLVRAVVRHRSTTAVPLVGALVGDIVVEGRAVMRREP